VSSQPTGPNAVHQPDRSVASPAQDKSAAMGGTGHAEALVTPAKADSPKTGLEVGQTPQGRNIDLDGDEITPSQLPTIVNTAKLVQGIGQSELRIGLQSRELGSVDIRTSIAAHTFSAQIFVEHRDVANTLSSELPGLYSRLADQRVLAGPIQIHSDGLATSAGFDQGQQQEYVPRTESNYRVGVFERESKAAPIFDVMAASDRLDIRI
jgi:flagellar hook-length control protein FliK